MIIEIFFDDDDALLERLREAGWTVEPAPAGAYMLATPDGFVGCRVVSDGGKVEPIGREAPRSA